jgi:hypothetical protein
VSIRVFAGALVLLGVALQASAAPLPPKPPTIADAQPDAHGVKRLAVLRGLDKISGRAIDIGAPIGVPVRFGTLTLTVRYCYTVPPEEPPETTAFVQIDDNPPSAPPKRMFSGWMFASTPALNALEHPTYDVWVITCKTDEAPPAASGTAGAAPPAGKLAPGPAPTPPAPRAAVAPSSAASPPTAAPARPQP